MTYNTIANSLCKRLKEAYCLPLIHNNKESANDRSGDGIRVELTYSGNKEGPSNTAQEAIDVRINSPPLITKKLSERYADQCKVTHVVPTA